MKNLFLSLLLLCSLSSCLANKVSNETLIPLARNAWPNVQQDYERGLADGIKQADLSLDQFNVLVGYGDKLGVALAAGNTLQLTTIPWDTVMRPWADRGIQAAVANGELGPNGAVILHQRVENFTNVIVTLQGKVVGLFNPRPVTDARLAQLVDHEIRVWANN